MGNQLRGIQLVYFQFSKAFIYQNTSRAKMLRHGDHRNEARQKILENRNKIILSNRCETNVKRRFAHAGLFQSLQYVAHKWELELYKECIIPACINSIFPP